MIVLDTHVALWLALEPDRIAPSARQAIASARSAARPLALATISLLELTTAYRKGRLELPAGLVPLLQEIESRFVMLPMTAAICGSSLALGSSIPDDPGDRIIAATAVVHGAALVTADRRLRETPGLEIIAA